MLTPSIDHQICHQLLSRWEGGLTCCFSTVITLLWMSLCGGEARGGKAWLQNDCRNSRAIPPCDNFSSSDNFPHVIIYPPCPQPNNFALWLFPLQVHNTTTHHLITSSNKKHVPKEEWLPEFKSNPSPVIISPPVYNSPTHPAPTNLFHHTFDSKFKSNPPMW